MLMVALTVLSELSKEMEEEEEEKEAVMLGGEGRGTWEELDIITFSL